MFPEFYFNYSDGGSVRRNGSNIYSGFVFRLSGDSLILGVLVRNDNDYCSRDIFTNKNTIYTDNNYKIYTYYLRDINKELRKLYRNMTMNYRTNQNGWNT